MKISAIHRILLPILSIVLFIGCIPQIEDDKLLVIPLKKGIAKNNGATPWYAEFYIGTSEVDSVNQNGQLVKLIMDSGTENTWITSSDCNTTPCNHHNKFNNKISISYHSVESNIKASNLGPWGDFHYILGKDQWNLFAFRSYNQKRLENIYVKNMVFMEAVKLIDGIDPDGTRNTNWDDLVQEGSLAIPSQYGVGKSTQLLALLNEQGKVSRKIVSYITWRDLNCGEVIFGGIDRSLIKKNTLEYFPVICKTCRKPDQEYLWTVPLTTITIDGRPMDLPDSVVFAFDSGSSRFKGDNAIMNAIIAIITDNGSKPVFVDEKGLLENYPEFTISLKNTDGQTVSYNLRPEQYFQKFPDGWQLAFHPFPASSHSGSEHVILAGSVFMDHYYTVFDYTTNPVRVGVAEKK